MISQDQFHEETNQEVIEKLKDLPYFSPIDKHIIKEKNILPYGRALKSGLTKQNPDLSELINYQKNGSCTKVVG